MSEEDATDLPVEVVAFRLLPHVAGKTELLNVVADLRPPADLNDLVLVDWSKRPPAT